MPKPAGSAWFPKDSAHGIPRGGRQVRRPQEPGPFRSHHPARRIAAPPRVTAGPGSASRKNTPVIMKERNIFVTAHDLRRLNELLAVAGTFNYRERNDLKSLEAELRRARIVESHAVPADVVTMNTRLRFVDSEDGTSTEVVLVFPAEANIDEGKLSVFSPIGTALLGYRKGDVIEWTVPGGVRRIRIEEILYQPEAAGDPEL